MHIFLIIILQLGHELETYDYRKHIIPYRISERIPFLYRWDMNRLNKGLIKRIEHFRPDIFLGNWGGSSTPGTDAYLINVLEWVCTGGGTPTESTTWGEIKGMFQ